MALGNPDAGKPPVLFDEGGGRRSLASCLFNPPTLLKTIAAGVRRLRGFEKGLLDAVKNRVTPSKLGVPPTSDIRHAAAMWLFCSYLLRPNQTIEHSPIRFNDRTRVCVARVGPRII